MCIIRRFEEGHTMSVCSKSLTPLLLQNYCIQYGANLASIHNQGEYDFIQESLMTDGQAWIGGNNAVRVICKHHFTEIHPYKS